MPEVGSFGPESFMEKTGVSRETLGLLERFDTFFCAWNNRLNLVAKSTIPDRWHRHYWDSAQLLPLIPEGAKTVMDFGSGGGFPGLLLALMGQHDPARQGQHYYLVDSVRKKCTFLNEAVAEFDLTNVTVINARIEDIQQPRKADIITARALADLDKLLGYARRFLHKESICLFLKGEKAQEELTAAAAHWKMTAIPHTSKTHDAAAILEIRNLSRV